jgi:hypothetical protein
MAMSLGRELCSMGPGIFTGLRTAEARTATEPFFELVAPVGTGTYKEKVLWSFNDTDGYQPHDSLILDGAGNLYGTTLQGGLYAYGVAFEVTP